MKKLSKIKNDEMLLVDNECMTKEELVATNNDYMNDKEWLKGKVFTTTSYKASFDARQIIEDAIEEESYNMYEDWEIDMSGSVREDDIKAIQEAFDRILKRNSINNIAYYENEEVEIDI